jgi:hypothetical protein
MKGIAKWRDAWTKWLPKKLKTKRRFEAEERARLDAEERRRERYESEHEQRMEV